MRNFLIATLVAMTAIFMSCNSSTTKVVNPESHTFTYTATCDTAIVVKVPIQSPIHTCSGLKSKYNKIVSWKDSTIVLHSGQTITISNDEMNGKGWYWYPYDPTTTTTTTTEGSDYGFPDWMKWVFWNLLIPALILYLAYLLGRWLWNNRSTATPNAPANPGADAVEQNRQYHPTFVDVTVINEMPEPPAESKSSPLFTITGGQGAMTIGNIHIHHVGDGNLKITEEVIPDVYSKTESETK